MDHPSRSKLAHYLLDLLDETTKQEITQHLLKCQSKSCRGEYLATVPQLDGLITQAIQCPSTELLVDYFVNPDTLSLADIVILYYHIHKSQCPDCHRGGD